MPAYNNPYFGPSYYPASYTGGYMPYQPVQQQMPVQQSYAPGPACAMAWVDGEIEARGRQMPQGVTQFAMWDTNRQVIYLKSLNQMGMPNPMQILHYTMEEQQSMLPAGQSGESGAQGNSSGNQTDTSQFVTKQDLEQLRNEIRNMNHGNSGNGGSQGMSGNQNGSNPGQNGSGNRGGNR